MKPREPSTFSRLVAQALGVCLIVCLGLLALFVRAPGKPIIALGSVRFAELGGEVGVVFSLTNSGWNSATLHDANLQVEMITSTGRRTESPRVVSSGTSRVRADEFREYFLPLPPDTVEWKASITYEYVARRDPLWILHRWVDRTEALEHLPTGLAESVHSWLEDWSIEPWKQERVSFPTQTNLPTSALTRPR